MNKRYPRISVAPKILSFEWAPALDRGFTVFMFLVRKWDTRFFIKETAFFQLSLNVAQLFSMNFKWTSNVVRCSSIHITMIILRDILHLVYLGPCLGLGLFMSYLCDLFLISSPIFITINHLTSLKQTDLFFVHFLEYLLVFLDDNVEEESK